MSRKIAPETIAYVVLGSKTSGSRNEGKGSELKMREMSHSFQQADYLVQQVIFRGVI